MNERADLSNLNSSSYLTLGRTDFNLSSFGMLKTNDVDESRDYMKKFHLYVRCQMRSPEIIRRSSLNFDIEDERFQYRNNSEGS